jgi:serine/threonine protein kinase
MQLWNDYEGKTIADVYSLGPLVRPEGRSALFALSDGADAPAIIRLTEAINDEGQMLACWRRVAEVKQENLVTIKHFGETNFEGTPLTYAVMEPTDANLDDLLKERPLTHAEAMQVATSVVAALTALHAKSLVHEHIDAANVLAVGETVKLRTDCVRECIVDPEHLTQEDCLNFRQRDVHDLAILLLRALTLEKKLKPGLRLPAPFDRIIPNGINGAWGLAEIAAALTPPAPQPPAARPVQTQNQAASPTAAAPRRPYAAPVLADESASADSPLHYQRRTQNPAAKSRQRVPVWAGLAVIAIIVLAVLLHGISSKPTPTPQSTATAPRIVVQRTPAATLPRPAATPKPLASPQPSTASAIQAGWYVVAYTFNHADQAASRAAAIAKRNPSLHPEVIAPSGRAPYLVALGGAMTRPQADATRNRAREAGMPRDTFVRDYKGS